MRLANARGVVSAYIAGCILTVDGFRTFGAAMGVKTPIPPLAKGRFYIGSISSEKSTSNSGAPEIAFATVSAMVVKVGKIAAARSSIANGFV